MIPLHYKLYYTLFTRNTAMKVSYNYLEDVNYIYTSVARFVLILVIILSCKLFEMSVSQQENKNMKPYHLLLWFVRVSLIFIRLRKTGNTIILH